LFFENAGRERDQKLEGRENSSEDDSTLVQQQQYVSWSWSSVHSNSYPIGHFNSFSFSILDPPVVVRGGVKQNSYITYYNLIFQEKKNNWQSKKRSQSSAFSRLAPKYCSGISRAKV
jgi:hypothetical protein